MSFGDLDGFAYGNARLRAMKARLLSARELEALVSIDSLPGLIAALTKTSYRKSIEAAVIRARGLACLDEAFHNEVLTSLRILRRFYQGSAGEAVGLLLRRYDLLNLKTILRSLAKHIPPGEIRPYLFPVGDLSGPELARLVQVPNIRAAIDTLVSMNLRCAQPLLALQGDHPGATPAEMELALDRWYFHEALMTLQSTDLLDGILHKALQLEADLVNLRTVLRFAHSLAERKALQQWLGGPDLHRLFLGPGRLSFDQLARAGDQHTLEAAIATLVGTPFEEPLQTGLRAYAQTDRLSVFERFLDRYRLHWLAWQIVRDPLGIGTPLGFLALKSNEIKNLRWIARGLDIGLTKEAIRAEIEMPP